MNQTAHISLHVLINFKERRDKRNSVRPNLFGAPRLEYLWFLVLRLVAVWPVWRPVGALVCASAPPVRGVLRLVADTRNPFFHKNAFFAKFPVFRLFSGVCVTNAALDLGSDVILLRKAPRPMS